MRKFGLFGRQRSCVSIVSFLLWAILLMVLKHAVGRGQTLFSAMAHDDTPFQVSDKSR
jgi:hypothetical protein